MRIRGGRDEIKAMGKIEIYDRVPVEYMIEMHDINEIKTKR